MVTACPAYTGIKDFRSRLPGTHGDILSLTAVCREYVQTDMSLDHCRNLKATRTDSQNQNITNFWNQKSERPENFPQKSILHLCVLLHISNFRTQQAVSNRRSEAAFLAVLITAVKASHTQWVAMRGSWYPGDLAIFTILKKTLE